MRLVLENFYAKVTNKTNLWQNDQMIYKMQSSAGRFDISIDNYGCTFINSAENQTGIKATAKAFSESVAFESESVNFSEYT
jgi:hypothetical protein